MDDCRKLIEGMNEGRKDLFEEIKYLREEIKRVKKEL